MELHGKIYFDTVAFIYWVEENPDFMHKVEAVVLDASEAGASFCTSVLSIAEFGVQPTAKGRQDLIFKFDELLLNADFDVLNVDREAAVISYQLRARYPTIKAIDALHLASAIQAGCDFFVTNDIRLKSIRELAICIIGEYA